MRHLMSPLDFSVEELDQLLDLAGDIEKNPAKYAHACDGKILATLFYEPSTRTRLSFESAMIHLGGQVLGFSSAASSSASKGESVSDTIRMISCYADIYGSDSRILDSCDQRRRRRTSAPHADSDRPDDDPVPERPPGSSDHRSVRRSEIRTYGAFAD